MVAAIPESNLSVAEDSSAMRNIEIPEQNTHFATFIETDDIDDNDDNGGGVMLRDFEDDSYASNGASTPMGTNSSSSSGIGCIIHPHKSPSVASFSRSATSSRRNTFAPIGTGRFSEHTATAKGGSLNAPVNSSDNETISTNVKRNSESTGWADSLITGTVRDQTHPSLDNSSQSSSVCGTQFCRSQGLDESTNMTPTAHRSETECSLSVSAMGYSWGSTPTYKSAGNLCNTPQTAGYCSANDGVYANMGAVTPSHLPKKVCRDTIATPQSTSLYSQYNQTEPRNFAPRVGANYMPPPPAFSLGHRGASEKHQELKCVGPDADPFLSPSPSSRGINGYGMSQALVLPSVPEDNQLAMAHVAYHDPVPAEIRAMRSAQLNKLTNGPMGLPTQEVALDPDNFPFIEATTQARPVGHGVVKIKNIPFGAKRAEIIAFLGRNSKILNDNQEPVHIIMERVSSKTQDCYVEFMTTQDAVRAVDRHRDNVQKGRPSRLGDRPVEVQLSSQAALMRDLFPLAAGVWWDNAKPVIQAPIDGQPWKTFKGFVTEEEMTMLVKHVEIPQRSPYSKECPQRPYECMISTIKKLPWYMADRITLRQRHAIYEATFKLVELLKQALQRDRRNHETVINSQLLKRLVTAAMLCPGFSVVQKDNIAALADIDFERTRMFNQPRFAEHWVHLHGICPRPGTPLDVLEWYIAVVREETTRYVQRKHLNERNEILRTACYTSLYFGFIWYELGLPTGKDLDNLTLRQAAQCELAVIERALRRVFPSQEQYALL